jgi:hypothetical protein
MTATRLRAHRFVLAGLLGALAFGPAMAQSGATYKLTEISINSGGDPGAGGPLSSMHFRISLDAVGEGAVLSGLASASLNVDAGFVGRYPPPGDVTGLRFNDPATLQWDPERSAGSYQIYRGTIDALPGTFGACFASDLPSASATDAAIPSVGGGFFYLVTASNRLFEEGTKGYRSNGAERGNPTPCP